MKFMKSAALALGLLLLSQMPASAQVTPTTVADAARIAAAGQPRYAFSDSRGIGVGWVILGAAFGIGMLAKSALESMARQPEVAANIQTSMIIAAALIEGATFFALLIIMLFLTPY